MEERQKEDFLRIDAALCIYYARLGHRYNDSNGIGYFMKYIINEELMDSDLPISNELGDDCDPSDCAYCWMHNEYEFPLPPNINITSPQKKEIFIFYILQFCFKNNRPPSDSEIKEEILCKIDDDDDDDDEHKEEPIYTKLPSPIPTHQEIQTFLSSEIEGDEIEGGIDTDFVFINTVKRISEEVFNGKYLNILKSKEVMDVLLYGLIKEKFAENADDLNCYIDGCVNLQINDGEMKIFKMLINDEESMISLINSDLYIKDKKDVLFGVIIPNKDGPVDEEEKHRWKFAEFLTAKQILLKYGIKSDELPISSRKKTKFVQELTQKIIINENLIDDTKWVFVEQIKWTKNHKKKEMAIFITITLNKKMWIKECKKSFENTDLPLIPIVVNKKNKHWIEWIKIINIESQNIYIAVSCKYDKNNNKWKVESIYLDGNDVYNMHLLVGIYDNKYTKQLRNIKTSITKIIFTDDNEDKLRENINSLKYQIKYQQDTITRIKGCILRINKKDNDNISALQQEIKCFVDDNNDNNSDKNKDDDVIKEYDVLIFRTKCVGAKGNIYINKQFVKSWINSVTPRFNDEVIMYYWFDHTISMQMIQEYSKQYVKKENKQFIVAIINLELKDNNKQILYGIIMYNDNNKNGDKYKYKYKLNALMTAEQIYKEYKINEYDLPKKSRKHNDFIGQLLLNRTITDNDINKVNWINVKLYKSPLNDNNDEEMNKSLTISTKILSEYIKIGVERMNECNLIPILCVDKSNNYYGVEWVLIINIIHSQCNIAVSFEFDKNKNIFILKAIYLNNTEIETKHKLIGLTHNFCQNIPSFSFKKFKLKSTD